MQFYFPIQILDLFDYKQFVSYVVQMWYKEINNNYECNIKKRVGNCTDYLLIFIDFSFCLYWKIEKCYTFAYEYISQLRKGNRRTQAIDALRLLLLLVFLNSPFPFLCHHITSFIFSLHIVCSEKIIFVHTVIFSLFEMISNPMELPVMISGRTVRLSGLIPQCLRLIQRILCAKTW